ncbi:MAG: phosphoribosyltransferase family protein [Candidatus Acidiferrales bacterium]
MNSQIRNREEAGRLLGLRLAAYKGRPDVIVLGLPRGGVAVAHEIAEALEVPLDVFLVRKLGVPGFEELAMGAIAMGGSELVDPDVVEEFDLSGSVIRGVAATERRELERREHIYRGSRPPLDVHNKTVILVDDGIATGSTIRVAIEALRKLYPARIIVAAAVAPLSTYLMLGSEADEVVCLLTPREFRAVGEFYADFPQLADVEVCKLLNDKREESALTH